MGFFDSLLTGIGNLLIAAEKQQARRTTLAAGRPHKYDPLLQEGSSPPSAPGLYQFRNELTGQVDYVGETADLNRRIGQHSRNGKIGPQHTVEWRQAAEGSRCAERRQDEERLITKHAPEMNKTRGGNGRTPRED